MTICIAAICTKEKEEHIVFAVDHMITTRIGQFEHSINKYSILSDNVVGMLSGDALLMDYFFDQNYSEKTYCEIQSIIEEKFKEKRLEKIRKEILDVHSIDFDFLREILKNETLNEFQSKILRNVIHFSLNTSILLIGFKNNDAKICEINEWSIEDFSKISFHTIGSGSIQAQNTLLFQNHSKADDLKTTLYDVYKAKKNAEAMQGVGKETGIGFLNKNGLTMLDEEDIKILDEIYHMELNCGKEHEKLNDLKF